MTLHPSFTAWYLVFLFRSQLHHNLCIGLGSIFLEVGCSVGGYMEPCYEHGRYAPAFS